LRVVRRSPLRVRPPGGSAAREVARAGLHLWLAAAGVVGHPLVPVRPLPAPLGRPPVPARSGSLRGPVPLGGAREPRRVRARRSVAVQTPEARRAGGVNPPVYRTTGGLTPPARQESRARDNRC